MKKTLIIGFIALLSVVLTFGFAYATVNGRCDSCHTMHNSQNGTSMNYNGSATPNELLLRGDCLGCHAQNAAGVVNIINTIPQVLHAAATDLAGGNFVYVTTSDIKGHNVSGIVGLDSILTDNSPPGYATGYDPASTKYNTGTRLYCAGTYGCHGNRDSANEMTSIKTAHHANDAVLKFGSITEASQGATIGTSYRFLYKVKGGENTSWANTSSSSHNEYKGATFASRASQAWSDINTVSELCAECHGVFHASATISNQTPPTGTPWTRHPTDAVIPASGEYSLMTTTYNVETPVGRPGSLDGYSTPGGTTAAGSDVVICLSCHAAHGSNYADILRWQYTVSMAAGTGCLRCHTGKSAY